VSSLDTQLLLSIKNTFGKQPVSTHYFYVRKLWQLAKELGLRQRRFLQNTKQIIDSLKTMPFHRMCFLEGRFNKLRTKHDGLTFVNPRYLDFFHKY